MLSEKIQNDFADRVAGYFGSQDKDLRKAALWLLDAGFGEVEIISHLGLVWGVAYGVGYDEGYVFVPGVED